MVLLKMSLKDYLDEVKAEEVIYEEDKKRADITHKKRLDVIYDKYMGAIDYDKCCTRLQELITKLKNIGSIYNHWAHYIVFPPPSALPKQTLDKLIDIFKEYYTKKALCGEWNHPHLSISCEQYNRIQKEFMTDEFKLFLHLLKITYIIRDDVSEDRWGN